jgi:uncharacterized protein (DUF58 family)
VETGHASDESRTSISPKTYALAAFSLILFLIAIVVKNAPLTFGAIVPILFLAAVLLTTEPPSTSLSVERTIERYQIYEKESCKVRLRVQNTGKAEIACLQIRDLIPSRLDGPSTQNGFTLSLKGGETKDLIYSIYTSSFGFYTIGPTVIEVSDAKGFFFSRKVSDQKTDLIVIPEPVTRLTSFSARPRKTKAWPGETPSRKIGFGANYNNIRPRIPGESLRKVNWRASARSSDQDYLFVNEFRAELGSEVMIVVDARTISDVGEKSNSTLIYSIKAAIAIADRLLKDRDRVGLLTIGDTLTIIRPGYGRRQFDRIVLSLVNLKSGYNWTIENLPNYLRFFFPNISQLILVSSLADDLSVRAAMDIELKGFDVAVISPNPVDIEKQIIFGSRRFLRRRANSQIQLAESIARLSRQTSMETLRSLGVLVVDWKVDDSLEDVIETSARIWSRQSHRPGLG